MDEVAKRKAEKANNNRLWAPQDAIEDALMRIKDKDPKKIHLMVAWREELDDETSKIHWSAANIQRHDQISLLELVKFDLIKDWFGY